MSHVHAKNPPTGASAPVAEGSRGDASKALERRILEELIYERVRLSLDLVELLAFEADLSASIDRALQSCAASKDERNELSLRFLERAWERLSAEVQAELTAAEYREATIAARAARGRS